MQLPIFEKYIDELIEKSTLDVPAWNIEKAREEKLPAGIILTAA